MSRRFMPLEAVRYTRKAERIVPFFMKNDDEAKKKVGEALRYYEGFIGRKMAEFNHLELADIMEDPKVGKGIQSVMENFCCFRSPDFSEIFAPDDIEALLRAGITGAEELRLALFEYINSNNKSYGGFAPESVREKAIEGFGKSIGLSESTEVERGLWIDREDERVLKKETLNELPGPEQAVAIYNMSVLLALLMNSGTVRITLPELGGSDLRRIYTACKYSGALCDILKMKDCGKYVLELTGPFEIFGRPEKYGRNLADAAVKILGILSGKEYTVTSDVFVKNRKYMFSIDRSEIASCIPAVYLGGGDDGKSKKVFDSNAEERIYGVFGHDKLSWNIEREPEPVITDNFVYIPDFAYLRGKSKVYVEIMGYFTEHYQKKKIEKLKSLHGLGIQMIIIANSGYDDAVRKEIEGIGYQVAYFRGKDMPYGTVLKILEERFSDFSERMSETESEKERIRKDVENELLRAGFVPDGALKEKLKCYSEDEFEKCRHLVPNCAKGTYLRGVGLFTAAKVDELKAITDEAHLDQKDRMYLEKRFLDVGVGSVDPVIAHFGYAVRWSGLGKTEIVKK